MDTSAIVSIQDLLRDHEEQTARAKRDAELAAKRAEEARVAAAERAYALEAQRARDAEATAEAKRYEAARRAAELDALKASALVRAKADAEAAERAAAARANAEHEQRLASLVNDKSKKRWRVGAVFSAVALGLALVAGTTTLKASHDRATAAEVELAGMRAQIQSAEQDKAQLAKQLEGARDPETIRQLTADIAAKDKEIARLNDIALHKKTPTTATNSAPVPVPTTTATQGASCTCEYAEDPFCDATRHCKILHPSPPR